MSDILTPDSAEAPKPKTVALKEGAVGHLLIQYHPERGVNLSGDGIDKIPPALLYVQLSTLREKVMVQLLMEEQQQAQREAATRVQPAAGRPRSPFGG